MFFAVKYEKLLIFVQGNHKNGVLIISVRNNMNIFTGVPSNWCLWITIVRKNSNLFK